MEQLTLELSPVRRNYQPLKDPSCPCCKQKVKQPDYLTVWQNFREWLYLNWEWAARELVRNLAAHPQGLSLAAHPDLLWALQADAADHELELSDRLAEILDGFFQGEFDELKRRGKALRLSSVLPDPMCKFCSAPMLEQPDGRWRCTADAWHTFWVNTELPEGRQGIWMGRNRFDPRSGPGPLPAWLPEIRVA